jgi:nitrite reductase (NADH) large subunit
MPDRGSALPQRLLILGNSAAALSAARANRARGGEQPITMVSREECSAYSPVLTTYYLRGKIPEHGLYICDIGSYRDLGITCHFGRAAVELDADAQRVTLDDGTGLDYDALLIATGASAKRLSGLDPEIAQEVCYLRTIEDARRIHEAAARAEHVVVFGAGLVSLQVASAVARSDLKVTCVVASGQILSQNVDADCAALLQEHVERSADISFLFGTNVTGIARADGGYRVLLDSGQELLADLLVAGKGVSPNVEFIDCSQIAVEAGVIVDDHLRTNVENVYAAGDLAQGRNRVSGASELVPNWINACKQGHVAGANMAGADLTFPGAVAENVTTLFGVPVVSIGISRIREEDAGLCETTYHDEGRGVYRRLILRGETMVGAVLLRDIEDAGVLRNAVVAGSRPWFSPAAVARGRVNQAQRLRACIHRI